MLECFVNGKMSESRGGRGGGREKSLDGSLYFDRRYIYTKQTSKKIGWAQAKLAKKKKTKKKHTHKHKN